MRATAQDPDTAALVGVNAKAVYARATAIAVATATLAGAFFAIRSTFVPTSGPTQLIFAFEAVVIGGLGSLWGTLWGGIVLGVAQAIGAHIDPQYAVLAGHLVFLAVLASPRGRAIAGGDSPMSTDDSPARPRPAGGWADGRSTSRISMAVVAVGLVLLAIVPLTLNDNAVEQLTSLLIFVILAGMWNALAGYGGMVVGRSAGVHRARRLRHHLLHPPRRPSLPRDGPRRARRRRAVAPAVGRRAAPARRPVRHRHLGRG